MHLRERHIQSVLARRAKIFPALGILGPRQVGKTTFLMKQWQKMHRADYVTFDRHETVARAKRAPEEFLLSSSDNLQTHLIIDEVQKVPALFDSMKSLIDEHRRIGAFTLSGSVEFSSRSGVRESLAGRIGLCRLYPLILSEIRQQPLHNPWVDGFARSEKSKTGADEIENWLNRGGMPIFCAIRDERERNIAIGSWLEALCYRDLHQLKTAPYDGDVAISILRSLARNPLLVIAGLANDLGVGRATVQKHLEGLKDLFLLNEIPLFMGKRGTSEYLPLDTAVFKYLYGDGDPLFARHQLVKILVINEILAQFEYSGESRPEISHYRSRGGAKVDLILRRRDRLLAIEIATSSDVKPYSLRGIKSFLSSYEKAEGIVLAPVTDAYSVERNLQVLPWTQVG
jgi:uncharacterized protein